MTLTDDPRSGTFTDRGWPRPIVDGWPIPWVSPTEHLGRTHPDRMKEVVDWAKCQVCGDCHKPWEVVYLLVNKDLTGEPPSNLEGKMLQAMDNAVMHERCVKLATGRCPALRQMRDDGKLILFAAYWRDIKIYDIPEDADDDSAGEQVLGIDGTKVWRAAFPEEL